MSLDVLTFGCRLNAAESEVIRARAGEAALDDALVVNTCAVTAEAVRQARQAIRKARRENPERRIVVTGCAAQTAPAAFAGMPEVDLVLGNSEKLSASSYRFGLTTEKVHVNDIFSMRETASHLAESFSDRARAFVQVQNGCDHRCTFCIIPFGRGNSRSVPAGAVVEQIGRIVERGCREIVLTGVDITAWGADLPGRPRLGRLVASILKHVPKLERLRLSSIDSIEADPELMHLIGSDERLLPHLHLSLQSGDDLILKRMKRRHLRDDAVRFCDEVRRLRPDVLLGADLIAGFPTEDDGMFENTERVIADCGLTLLHVFPFSPREGTPAARMPQLPRNVVKERAARLRALGANALAARLAAEVGKTRSVLVEQPGFGRTEHYLPVKLDRENPGEIVSVLVRSASAHEVVASAFREAA